MLDERQIQKYTLLYPLQGIKGRPNRVATVLSKQSLTQQLLAQENRHRSTRYTPRIPAT
jgi:hypothetical protein